VKVKKGLKHLYIKNQQRQKFNAKLELLCSLADKLAQQMKTNFLGTPTLWLCLYYELSGTPQKEGETRQRQVKETERVIHGVRRVGR
jgi:hypothetical protein